MSITIDCFSVNMISQEIPAYFLHVEQLTLKQFRTCLLHEETVLWQQNKRDLFEKFCPKEIAESVVHTNFAHHEFSFGDVIYVISSKHNDRSTCVFKRLEIFPVSDDSEAVIVHEGEEQVPEEVAEEV